MHFSLSSSTNQKPICAFCICLFRQIENHVARKCGEHHFTMRRKILPNPKSNFLPVTWIYLFMCAFLAKHSSLLSADMCNFSKNIYNSVAAVGLGSVRGFRTPKYSQCWGRTRSMSNRETSGLCKLEDLKWQPKGSFFEQFPDVSESVMNNKPWSSIASRSAGDSLNAQSLSDCLENYVESSDLKILESNKLQTDS